jgi:hypothetical protein
MASHVHGTVDLDEFFDFDQLDRDHGADSVNLAEDCMPMDWTDNNPLSVSTLDSVLSDELQTPSAPYQDLFLEHAHWPLVINSDQVLPGSETYVGPIPHLVCTPPLSRIASTQPHVVNDGHKHMSVFDPAPKSLPAGLEVPCMEVTTLPGTGNVTVHPRAQLPSPLRQASSASWKPASAKRKGPQGRIPFESRQILEDEFATNAYPCSWEIDIIAHQANLDVKKVRNWFNNTRARKKNGGEYCFVQQPYQSRLHPLDAEVVQPEAPDAVGRSLDSKSLKDSLEALDLQLDEEVQPPQPLAVYLAQSYQEEAIQYPDIQAALESGSLNGSHEYDDDWSNTRRERTGSVINSIASSEGTSPTTYTVSSSGSHSNISSFGRDRRRGRRRMAWKESPYNNRPKFNGVNSAGEPQKDLPFFCTFCARAFKTRYEWIRHEDSVHALRTTWICCDTKTASIETCPFCGQMYPDDAHMAGHKYHQCWSKPESQRTFYRRDHFVQHLHHVHFANTKHPSVRVGCQARLLATEGHNFGCKDLALKWRRFGPPMKQDDPMLHCGMCGKKSKDWSERCDHVAEHLIAREFDRSVWWSDRKENHLENLYSASPFESFRCRYCLKVFTDVADMNQHSHCKVWSCRFLKSFDDVTSNNAGPPLCPELPSTKTHHCHLCGAGYRTPHSEHAQSYHRYRSCNQEFYNSEVAFLQHLHNFHGASPPAVLQGCSVIEQNYLRNKGASFEPVEFNESWQPCLMDLDSTPIGFTVDSGSSTTTTTRANEKKAHNHTKKPASVHKKAREEPYQGPYNVPKTLRHRSDTTVSRYETSSPRFFRLSTYTPFLSSRIFYSQHSKHAQLPMEHPAVLEDIPKPHVASLVMSAGLVGMAIVRWTIKPQHHFPSGMIELTLDDID